MVPLLKPLYIIKKEAKMRLNKSEMYEINGGGITSAWVNAISKTVGPIYELGRQTGSAIRRLFNGSYCPLN